jgi:hypothetical protein
LWEYASGKWTFLDSAPYGLPHNVTLSPRFGAAIAYDSLHGSVLLVGGCAPGIISGCGPLTQVSDVWKFVNGTWSQLTGGPSARWDSSLAYDAVAHLFVLFGGCSSLSWTCSNELSDTWTFNWASWVQVSPTTHPSARGDASLAYDQADSRIVLFGGEGCGSVCGDTWTFTNTTPTYWTLLSGSTHPIASLGAAMTYDGHDGYVLLFGGKVAGGGVSSQTWSFTLSSGWVSITGGFPPSARFDSTMTYDSARGIVILFGGYGSTLLGDTWFYAGGSWSLSAVAGPTTPNLSWGGTLIYDPTVGPSGLVLLLGGSTGSDTTSAALTGGAGPESGQTWAFYPTPNPSLIGPGDPTWLSVGYVT